MKDKVCLICHTAIDTDKEFCEFKHYKKKDVIQSKAYYHVNCFRDRLKGSQEMNDMKKKANEILKRAGEIIGVEEKKEVLILN